jgi:hypothetical protein
MVCRTIPYTQLGTIIRVSHIHTFVRIGGPANLTSTGSWQSPLLIEPFAIRETFIQPYSISIVGFTSGNIHAIMVIACPAEWLSHTKNIDET